jgi:SAM-dependent methyltransferase
MKDYFSTQSKAYAAFRPTYPEDLYQFIFHYVRKKSVAWDCATGNGQVAQRLASDFEKVHASDISVQQLDNAFKKDNIYYSVSPAERTSFSDHQFDLITVAQALHWFDRDAFFTEVRRVCKPGGILAIWGYGLLNIDPTIDKLIMGFYNGTVGPYWDNARRMVEDEYRSISFPFEIIASPPFTITVQWTLDQLAGYLSSWSATQGFIRERGYDPVEAFVKSLANYWHATEMTVKFPIFSNLSRVII